MPYYDRFDIVEAYYAFFSDYHDGQWSVYYLRLCKMLHYFKPSPLFRGFDSLSENGKEIYLQLASLR